jgi:hypothetical protein
VGTVWNGQISNKIRQAKPREPSQAKEWVEGNIAMPHGEEGQSISRERGRDDVVLLRLVAQVPMSVIQQSHNIACKIE